MSYLSIQYAVDDRVATIPLNRPDRLNAIDHHMPREIRAAVERAGKDDAVHVILLTGAGRAFCAGYDLMAYAQTQGENPGVQSMPWDPTVDFRMMYQNTLDFQSLWRSHKPTIAKVHGYAVAGGSDIALSCDLVVMANDAKIGYPPARVWGCPTTAMWVFRVGAERATRMLLTGDLVDGRAAQAMGLVSEAVPDADLDAHVAAMALRMAAVPKNQLMMQKLVINQAYENMGLVSTQVLATLCDGIARHTPEGLWFKQRAEAVGFKQAVAERDGGQPIAPEAEKRVRLPEV
ncbi:MAG TPA: crotonase/enoyl-CoA hydratase family protein, partial [Polyangiaceae bacterium]|nr:crotonase/enoyl-CoA hydratase family protein [Polyangiaceae bacterium]